jgi:hypothetical protein
MDHLSLSDLGLPVLEVMVGQSAAVVRNPSIIYT